MADGLADTDIKRWFSRYGYYWKWHPLADGLAAMDVRRSGTQFLPARFMGRCAKTSAVKHLVTRMRSSVHHWQQYVKKLKHAAIRKPRNPFLGHSKDEESFLVRDHVFSGKYFFFVVVGNVQSIGQSSIGADRCPPHQSAIVISCDISKLYY